MASPVRSGAGSSTIGPSSSADGEVTGDTVAGGRVGDGEGVGEADVGVGTGGGGGGVGETLLGDGAGAAVVGLGLGRVDVRVGLGVRLGLGDAEVGDGVGEGDGVDVAVGIGVCASAGAVPMTTAATPMTTDAAARPARLMGGSISCVQTRETSTADAVDVASRSSATICSSSSEVGTRISPAFSRAAYSAIAAPPVSSGSQP